MLIVCNTNAKGRGVFAQKRFSKGEIIERSPVIVIPTEQVKLIDQTVLFDHYYVWNERRAAIALGFGSLYNHSYHPNSFYVKKFDECIVEHIAYRDIEVGEEITANYNGSVDDLSPIWFNVVD